MKSVNKGCNNKAYDWIETDIASFAPFVYGKGLSEEKRNHCGYVPVYGSNGIIGFHDIPLVEDPTVIIGRKGTVGAVHFCKAGCWPIDTTFYYAGKDVDSVRYAYYVLKSVGLDKMNSDSAVPGLNRDTAHARIIRIPSDISEQRRIAHILGTLDDKIENNRKTAKTLEAMAQAIFQSWFVDFDPVRAKMAGESRESICKRLKLTPEILDLFPDRLVDSELGEIPEGWSVKQLGGLVSIVKGRSYKSEELSESDTALVTLKSFARGGGYRLDGLKPFTGTYKQEQLLRSGDMLIACTDVTQAAEVIGRPIIIRENSRYRNLVASLDTIIVRPLKSSLNHTYLYYLCATDLFSCHTGTYVTGTTVLHLSKEAIPSFKFAFATYNLVVLFQKKVLPLLKRNEVVETEYELLARVRDTLLPKLISGEIRVPETEHLIQATMETTA